MRLLHAGQHPHTRRDREAGHASTGEAPDSPEKNLKFKNKQDFQFPLWSDDGRALAKAYGAARALGVPYARRVSVIIDPEGVWRWHYTKVSPAQHPGEVLADLRQIIRD